MNICLTSRLISIPQAKKLKLFFTRQASQSFRYCRYLSQNSKDDFLEKLDSSFVSPLFIHYSLVQAELETFNFPKLQKRKFYNGTEGFKILFIVAA